jgi:hypothetical protein
LTKENPLKVIDIIREHLIMEDISKILPTSHSQLPQLVATIDGDSYSAKVCHYILLIPLFIYLEALLKNKKLFKRRLNSILDMKEASNFHNFNKRGF